MTAMNWETVLNTIEDYEDFEDAYTEQAHKPNRNSAVSNQRLERKASRLALQSERNAGRQTKDLSRGLNNHRGTRKVSELQAIDQER